MSFVLRPAGLVAVAFLALVPGLSAGLEWQSALVEHALGPAADSGTPAVSVAATSDLAPIIDTDSGTGPLEFVFHFTVTGDQPVHISKVVPDCGCTVARLDKSDYAPGESGRIVATFTPGDRQGLQEKHFRVFASDQSTPHRLTLRVKIPELVTVERRHLVWERNEDLAPKRVRLTSLPGLTLHVQPLNLEQSRLVRADLVGGKVPNEFFLELTPLTDPARPALRPTGLVPVNVQVLRGTTAMPPLTVFARFVR